MSLRASFGWRHAGLISVWCDVCSVHLGVSRGCWQLGFRSDWYDGPRPSFGLGPIILVCW